MNPDTPAPPVNVPGNGELRATIRTSLGDITVRLFEKETPRTVANFVALATGGVEWTTPSGEKSTKPLYSGTVIHRVIPEFMVQMGCPKGNGTGGPGWRFDDEFVGSLRHDKPGVLSMANAGPKTNGSQFFVTEVPTPHLDNRHTVFGEVVDASQVEMVKKIARVPTSSGNRPVEDIVLQEITVFRA